MNSKNPNKKPKPRRRAKPIKPDAITREIIDKYGEVLQEHRNWNTFKDEVIITSSIKKKIIDRVINTMYMWIDLNPEALDFLEFLVAYKIPRSTFVYWLDDPDLQKAHKNIKAILGMRRMNGAIRNQYNAQVILKDQHRFDPDYDAVNQYWHKISMERIASKQSNDQPTQLTVVMQSPPPLEEKDE